MAQRPWTAPFDPGVVHGTVGAAPTTGEGSVIATTSARAAMPTPRLVVLSEGMMARDNNSAAVPIPTAITTVCGSVNRPAPKISTAPESHWTGTIAPRHLLGPGNRYHDTPRQAADTTGARAARATRRLTLIAA